MTYEELISRLDPATYMSLRKAVELGKWPDGRVLSKEQQSLCLEAVIWYEEKHQVPDDQRVGYVDRGAKACGTKKDDDGPDPIRILN